MALTLFPPRAPSRQGSQMPDSHAPNHISHSSSNFASFEHQKASHEVHQRLASQDQMKTTLAGRMSASAPSLPSEVADNRISIVPPLPNFGSRSESRSASPGPYRSANNSRQNSPTRAAQNLTPPPTVSLPQLPADAPTHMKNGRPVSPNTHVKAHTIAKASYLAGAKMKAKETFLRRKGSMPDIKTTPPLARELEPELPMDSPTIPGRPPAHDRQQSLPASAFSAPPFGEPMFKRTEGKEHKRSASTARDIDRSKVLLHKRSESALKLADPPKLQSQTAKMSPVGTLAPILSPGVAPAGFGTASPPSDLPPIVPPKDTAPLNVNRVPVLRARTGSEPTAERAGPTKSFAHKRQTSAQELKAEPHRVKTTITVQTSTANKRKSTANRIMPRGMRPVDVVKTLQQPVIESLQSAARKTCEKFAVLSPPEVDTLTAELASLEERCEYLRRTHQSLRSGKKALHMKMLQHLRSDRSGGFSRETLLKQQEALADLDSSIDDWEAKMERVHRKLLEHVAAALSISNPLDRTAVDTPPSTPENRNSLEDKTQSIKVYALLADVENEYGKMFTEARSS
ncbi:hypothetical protein DRE_00006 [Drechslerella stenobrocha 248]|uniref:Up-regulated during septation protein 1 domain-containing protein n=1 Tax=Drechslerella stenobrocha 248 TaxID=1043628 RepID=W7HX00_9PEZI|nr:hypothetical protein DRE_00006 [Drechslerella stenobrocha 248]